MYTYYSQNDAKWSDVRFSPAKIRIADYGCAITACAAVGQWLFSEMGKKDTITPKDVAEKSKFTADWMLIWSSLPAPLKFVNRYYKYDKARAYEILRSHWNACLLEVQWGRQKHWVVLMGFGNDGMPIVHDTWDGKRKEWKKTPFSAITGMAELTKI